MSSFSNMLIKLRKQDCLTQVEAAKQIGITRSALSMYETGQREPDFETLELIADYYNVDMNTLLGGSTVHKPPAQLLSIRPTLTEKLARLDAVDQEKVEIFTDGLLTHEKYAPKPVSSVG